MDTRQKIQILDGCNDKNVSPSIADATRTKCKDIIKKLAQSVTDKSKKTEANAAFKTLYDKEAVFKKFADKRLTELRKAVKVPAKGQKTKGGGKTTKGANPKANAGAAKKAAKAKANAADYDDYYYEGDYYQNDEGYDGYDGYDAASWYSPGGSNSGQKTQAKAHKKLDKKDDAKRFQKPGSMIEKGRKAERDRAKRDRPKHEKPQSVEPKSEKPEKKVTAKKDNGDNAAADYDDYYQNDEGYDGYDGYSNEYDAASWSDQVVGDGNLGYSSYDIQSPPHPHVQRGYGVGYGSYGQDYSSMIMSISLVFNVVLFTLLICAVGAICVAVYGYFICKMHKTQRRDLIANKDYAIVANREEDNEPEV